MKDILSLFFYLVLAAGAIGLFVNMKNSGWSFSAPSFAVTAKEVSPDSGSLNPSEKLLAEVKSLKAGKLSIQDKMKLVNKYIALKEERAEFIMSKLKQNNDMKNKETQELFNELCKLTSLDPLGQLRMPKSVDASSRSTPYGVWFLSYLDRSCALSDKIVAALQQVGKANNMIMR